MAVVGEGRTTLDEAVLEKDLLLTEVLHALSATDSEGIGLVFCGGTCLSKAHRLIERMSEDIDFKLIVPEGLSRTARSRMLSQYKKRLAQDLEQMGFLVPADQIVARDENSYVALHLHYESQFPPVASLRPEIKIELNARPPALPTVSLPIRSMLSHLLDAASFASSPSPAIACVGIEETLAEKVLSFLRRTAEARAGRNRAPYDDRLVRHLYDVRAISRVLQDLELPRAHFAAMVAGDARQFRNQYPEFEGNPAAPMRAVLRELQDGAGNFAKDYTRFVDELVFGEAVSFDEARAAFIEIADQLVSSLPTDQESDPERDGGAAAADSPQP